MELLLSSFIDGFFWVVLLQSFDGWKFHFQIPDGGATPIRTEMADINTRAPFLPSSTVMGRRPSLPMTSLPAVVEKMGKESWDESGFGSMLSAPSSQASGLTT